MKFHYLAACLALIIFPPPILATNGGWSDPTKAQYHIQTDEGPERYFKYQTLSGQYRKEKRLEDGTVIGTYGWVDDDGFLRMRDYIADNAGYRILKTKNVFVGRNRPVNEALSIAKKVPGEAGTLVSPVSKTVSTPYTPSTYSQPTTKYSTPLPQSTYPYNSPANVQVLPIGYSTEHLQTPIFKYATLTLPQTTTSLGYNTQPYLGYTPSVEVSPNSIPSSTEAPISVTTAVPSSTILPPEVRSSTPTPPISSTIPPTVYIPSTTPSPSASSTPAYQSSSLRYTIPATNYGAPVPSTFKYVSPTPASYSSPNNYAAVPTVSTLAPPIRSDVLDPSLYSSDPQYEHYPDEDKKPFVNPYIYQNGPTYPIDKFGHSYNGQSNNIGNGYDPQFRYYDGVSVTNDGFRYYIPKQYHEEQRLSDDTKSGSFGYVDPFGIRRVIYYNAGPDGFKHRKNNRYVGLNATPYDPRPY
ncbi:hypothetical protein ILUMI_25829 [Ignelater luminosus]|uniref:Cuticle protein n=1 Tax=Ignelater luminosus TaxID=2038154 RepID=A0A8K0C7P8_IGNLU|nr:hypothetical protein ILUMI_25829 [Ignelater luminosus]